MIARDAMAVMGFCGLLEIKSINLMKLLKI